MGTSPVVPKQDNTVAFLDLVRFSGKWFEIAKIPLIWEKTCVSTEASYEFDLKNNKMYVENICKGSNQEELLRRIGIVSRVDEKDKGGKLRLNFTDGLPSSGEHDFWVLLVYYESFSIVGNKQKNQVWILSRSQNIPTCLYGAILRKLNAHFDYDTSKIVANKNALSKCVHSN